VVPTDGIQRGPPCAGTNYDATQVLGAGRARSAAAEQIAERLGAEGLTPTSGVAPVEQEHRHRYEVTGTCSTGACAVAEWGAAGRSGSSALGAIPDGRLVDVRCQTQGERVSGDNGRSSTIWDQLTNRAFVFDFYLSTPNVGQFSPPIPRC
jgi:hypothetical protein